MRKEIKETLKRLYEELHKRRATILTLSAIVVFVTTYLLILPALTLEKDKAAEQGGTDVPEVTFVSEDSPADSEEKTESADTGQNDPSPEKGADAADEESGLDAESVDDHADTTPDTNDGSIDDAAPEEKIINEESVVPDDNAGETSGAISGEKIKEPGKNQSCMLKYTGENYVIEVSDENNTLPEGTELNVEEIRRDDHKKEFDKLYDDAIDAIQKDEGKTKAAAFTDARFFDITLVKDGKKIELEESVNVKITYDNAVPVAGESKVRIVHFAEDPDTGDTTAEVLDKKNVEVKVEDKAMTETGFDALQFSVYAVVYEEISTDVLTSDGKTYTVKVQYDKNAGIPDGSELKIKEISEGEDQYSNYLGKAVKAVQEHADLKVSETSDLKDNYARFFDITIMNGEEKVEPKAAVKVDIKLADVPETDDEWKVVHFTSSGPVVMDSEAVTDNKTDAVEMSFDTDGFSVYGVITVPSAQPDPALTELDGKSFTISNNSRYMTTNITPIENGNNTSGFGKTNSANSAATWYFEHPSGASGNTYYIYTLVNGEKRYVNLTKNNSNTDRANASLSGNPQAFTVTREGNNYRLATQSNGTTYYLDEHNGNNGNAFAGWHGATDNGRLTLNFSTQPVMNDNGQYMALVKHEGKYYIVNNDCSLTEVKYDEATKTVEVDDPMLWTVNKNNPNGHIYFNSTEAGFNNLQTASDWYRRYMDPSTETGYLEETNQQGPGHVDIDAGTQHTHEGITYWEHQITNRRNVERATTVSIDNSTTSDSELYNIYHGNKNGSNYLGVVTNADGTLRLAGQQSVGNAAEFVFATPTGVKDVDWRNHTVNHIDISIAGTANVSVPLAYGKYYGSEAGDAADPILEITDNYKIDLSEAQMVDPGQLRITAEDMKRATVTAARLDNGQTVDDAFYITGYSGNVANGTSNDQVRIEGSFMAADLRGKQYETVDNSNSRYTGQWNNRWNRWDIEPDWNYVNAVNAARKSNIVEYTVTVVKPLTYNLIDPDLGQLYDADGHPITVTVDVAFSASFNYWDSRNECPAVHWATGFGGEAWTSGGIDPSNISGMDFVLGGNADNPDSPLVALEITKVIMDEDGNRIELKTPVTNYFDIYENKNATNDQKNAVQGLHVVDSLNHPEWQADPRDANIHNGYEYWRTKRVTVDESGSALVFDFNATDAMYYIVEKHDEESLPETVVDKDNNEYTYVRTYIETEYVRRDDDAGTNDEFSNKTTHPHAMHVTDNYTRNSSGDSAYASIPEVAGKFIKLDGTPKKEGFLEFYVYNIYKPKEYPVGIKKVDTADTSKTLQGAKFNIYGPYESARSADTDAADGRKHTLLKGDITTGTEGKVKIGDLKEGYYYLYETVAPDSYILMTDPIMIHVDSSQGEGNEVSYEQLGNASSQTSGASYVDEDGYYTLVITNTAGAVLPETGGMGTTWLYVIGALLAIGSGILLAGRRWAEAK